MNGAFCKKGADVTSYPSIPLEKYRELPVEEMRERIDEFYKDMDRRRTVREFADKPVPRDIIETALKAANTAPSGANLQPWHFAVVSGPETKKRIREAAEIEESEEWLAALQPLGTDDRKPFLETAPYLIRVLAEIRRTGRWPQGKTLLPGRIDRSGDRYINYRAAQGRSCNTDPHAEPDEISERNSGQTQK
jgi:hypothetical protein